MEGENSLGDLEEFIDRLSSADPVPGGGSVAALQAAMAGALLSMVASLTLGRKRYADVEEPVSRIREQATTLSRRSLELVDEDIDAYRAVADVLNLPKGTEAEKEFRSQRMQEALRGAVTPPLQTMTVASSLLELSAELAPIGNRSAISDVGTAAGSARAAFEAARLNVEINLASIRDSDWVARVREQLSAFAPAADVEERVAQYVLGAIRG